MTARWATRTSGKEHASVFGACIGGGIAAVCYGVPDLLSAGIAHESQCKDAAKGAQYMRGFAAAWPDPIVQQPVAQLPWGHITVLLDKAETPDQRAWYASAALEYGWSGTCS